MIRDPLSVAGVIAAATGIAFWVERRFGWGPKVGAALVAIVIGAALSNLGLVPAESPIYDGIFGPVTSLAIVWLLFGVNLRDLRAAGLPMLAAFGIAVAGTAAGAILATLLFAPHFGPEAWKLSGAMTGTYSGGSLNFVSVGRGVELSASTFTAAAAADNVVTAAWIGATLMLPVWLARFYPPPAWPAPAAPAETGGPVEPAEARAPGGSAGGTGSPAPAPSSADRAAAEGGSGHALFGDRPGMLDLAALLAVGLVLLRAADLLAVAVPAIPSVLWLTTLALLVAQLPAVKRLDGAMRLGYLALHFFFVLIGISSRVSEIAAVGIEVLWFTALVVAIHGAVVYLGARLVRLDVATASVASQAAVGGPPTALALAVARKWPRLALPGIAVGLLGYAVGNYVGFGVAYLMRGVLGG